VDFQLLPCTFERGFETAGFFSAKNSISKFQQNSHWPPRMVLLGEVGGREEYLVAEAIKDGRITKPLVAWCCGTAAEAFDYEVWSCF